MTSVHFKPLDDGTFLKRHAKLELDEKRRKRYSNELTKAVWCLEFN